MLQKYHFSTILHFNSQVAIVVFTNKIAQVVTMFNSHERTKEFNVYSHFKLNIKHEL